MESPAANQLVFVVGLWRSGTSLLHAMLNLHPQIRLMYESEPLLLWPPNRNARWSANWSQRLEFFNQTISRHQLDVEKLPHLPQGREAVLAMFEQYASHKGAVIKGGKVTAYHTMLPAVRAMFPEARFVILWRAPEACCRSALQAGLSDDFFAQPGMLSRILFGTNELALGVAALRARGGLVHEVVYQELVAEPEKELRALCAFIGVAYTPNMLNLGQADLSHLPPGPHHDGVRAGTILGSNRAAGQVLPNRGLSPAWRAKIGRYQHLWRTAYPQLALARAIPEAPNRPPGTVEQWLDRLGYFFWCRLDQVKFLLFARLPLAWWRKLRSLTVKPKPELPPGQPSATSGPAGL